jgi:hypothetical protein
MDITLNRSAEAAAISDVGPKAAGQELQEIQPNDRWDQYR